MTIKGVDLSQVERKRFVFDWMLIFLVIIIICSVGGFLAYGKKLDVEINNQNNTIVKIDNEIKEIKAKIPDKDKIIAEIADYEQQIVAIEVISKDPFKYRNLLMALQTLIPKNIYLDSLSIESAGSGVALSGKSVALAGYPPLACISKFMQNLSGSPMFQDINLSSASQTSSKDELYYSFQISAKFNPQEAAQAGKTVEGVKSNE